MRGRSFIIISLSLLTGCAALKKPVAPTTIPANQTREISQTNPLRGRPGMVDRLVMVDSVDSFAKGELKFVEIKANTGSAGHVVLHDTRERTYPRYGTWTSPQVKTKFPFTELIPSWNVITPPDTGVRFDLRTRDAESGQWSPWLYVGQWGRTLAKEPRIRTCDAGVIHTDVLVLDRPADAYQVRATLESFDLDTSINPSMRRITVSYSGQTSDPAQHGEPILASSSEPDWIRDLTVPFRAQGTAPRNLSGSICSPTSTSMVMAFFGVDRPIIENALAIYDDEQDIFGNWSRAVQRAGELGLDAWITRIRNWDQAKALIAQNQPIVAAINFRKGEFPSNVMQQTNGHLIVIRGFKSNGDVICNDPASRERGNGIVYKADELGKAWFDNAGGVAYIVRKPPFDPSLTTQRSSP